MGPTRAPRRRWLLLVALCTVVAIPPRLIDLGSPGFYGDEDTSALPARSVAEGHGAFMPSGMAYRRALLHTWTMALAARVLGEERELPYRMPAALFGILTIPLLFLVGRHFVRPDAALLAALALALSEWHVVFSRQARMYVPFLFFFLLVALWASRWSRRGRAADLVLMLVAFAGAVSMHALAIFAVLFVLLPLVRPGPRAVRSATLLAVAVLMAVAAFAYDHLVVLSAFQRAGAGELSGELASAAGSQWRFPVSPLLTMLGGVLGALVGLRVVLPRAGGEYATWPARAASLVGTFACLGAGLLFGAALSGLVYLLISSDHRAALWRRMRPAALLAALVAMAWLGTMIAVRGPYAGLRAVGTMPYPHLALLLVHLLGVGALFAAATLTLALRTPFRDDGIRAACVAAILPAAAVGIMSDAGNLRYLLPAYPFILLVAAAGLIWLLRRFVPFRFVLPLGTVVVLSGILGGHGLSQAAGVVTLRPGDPVDERIHIFPFRPDHAGPGSILRDELRPTDVVVAEDVIVQRWYVGRVDFWLRSLADAQDALTRDRQGALRDVYTSSCLVSSRALLDSLGRVRSARVWLITSGETAPHRSAYLERWQLSWLDSLERSRSPWAVGRDGATAVYCLNCESGAARIAR